MNPEQQQRRIIGYFIEEAKDHLQTIEQGVLNLQETLADSEMVNEVFRAAHSIKGGAAMLGVSGIQHIAHRLEDYFKILKDRPNVEVDEKLKSFLLAGFDRLQELLDHLQSNYSVTDELTTAAITEVEPIFSQLEAHLNQLVASPGSKEMVTSSAKSKLKDGSDALNKAFQIDVTAKLREMLRLFKQEDEPFSRQDLESLCDEFHRLGEKFNLNSWCEIVAASRSAIANTDNAYRTLAPIVIKNIKQAQELVLAQRESEILISAQLQALIPQSNLAIVDEDDETSGIFLATPASEEASELTDLFDSTPDLENSVSSFFEDLDASEDDSGVLFTRHAVANETHTSDSSGSNEDDALFFGTENEPEENDLGLGNFFANTDEFRDISDSQFWDERESDFSKEAFSDESAPELDANFLWADPSASVRQATEVTPSAETEDETDSLDLNDLFDLVSGSDVAEVEVPTGNDMAGQANLTAESKDESSLLDEEELSGTSATSTLANLANFFDGEDIFDTVEENLDSPEVLDGNPMNGLPPEQIESSAIARDLVSSDEFDELEALFDRPNPAVATERQSVGNARVIDDDFADLESLLDGPVSEPILPSKNKPQTSQTKDGFDELEALLMDTDKETERVPTRSKRSPVDKRSRQKIVAQTMKVDVKNLDSLNNLVGELVVNRNLLEEDQERLQQFIGNLLYQVQQLSEVSQRMRDQYDRSLLESSLLTNRSPIYSSGSFGSESIHHEGGIAVGVSTAFDALEMDRFSSFHTLSQEIIELIVRVRESASDIEFVVSETEQVGRQLGTITNQIQDDLKQVRMMPFAQIADRLPRAVRDISFKTGKQADIEIYGRETLVDKAILEQLYDPMTHLVNNAIVHGLEKPETRQGASKPSLGKIIVRAYHQGNQTVISIGDDGAGIDTQQVKQKAVEKGLCTPAEVRQLSDTDTYDLLFEPGFSTKDKADDLSGRGVGLDVVSNALSEIRGTIYTESEVGKGTTFTIRLPLTLSVSKAMFCVSDRTRIAFPVDGFEDMLEIPQSQLQLNSKGQPCFPWRDTVLPFQPLSNLLNYSRHNSRGNVYGRQDDDVISIVILRNEGNYLALQVDQFLGENEIVIKQLEGPIPKPPGIAGATILGDGRVMAIANVLELFDIASGRLRVDTRTPMETIGEDEIISDPTVLIVDDSITVRELLSLTFAKVGYRVEQARDGQDAWEKLRAGLPCDLIFCDIEMPRMDGLDLLARLQKDPHLNKIPVAMLTSRGADRHRQTAIQLGAKGYFTKPYLEEELLSASQRMLKGEVLVS